jgi:DNA-binding transcriptional ArsR family regulator
MDDMIHNVAQSAPGLIPLFRSDAQLRLLAELFVGAEGELSVGELVQRTGIPQATVSRELARLERHDLVTSRHLGRTRLAAANWDLPWATELRSILAQTVGVVALLSDALGPVSGINETYVFGSWAARFNGAPGPFPRDVDVLVVGDPDRRALMRAGRSVETQLRIDVNAVVVAPGTWKRPERDSFYAQVRSGPLVPIPLRRET